MNDTDTLVKSDSLSPISSLSFSPLWPAHWSGTKEGRRLLNAHPKKGHQDVIGAHALKLSLIPIPVISLSLSLYQFRSLSVQSDFYSCAFLSLLLACFSSSSSLPQALSFSFVDSTSPFNRYKHKPCIRDPPLLHACGELMPSQKEEKEEEEVVQNKLDTRARAPILSPPSVCSLSK